MPSNQPFPAKAHTTRRSRAALVILALWLGFAASAFSQAGAPYKQPDFQKKLFERESILLESQEISATITALAAIASNFPGSQDVDHILRAKAIAIALRLDGTHPRALAANRALVQGQVPSAISEFNTLAEVARQLWTTADHLESPEKNRDERVLQFCLVDMARQIDATNLADSNRYPTQIPKAAFAGWNTIVQGAESGFVFPEKKDPPKPAPGPAADPAPQMPAAPANPTRAAKGQITSLVAGGKIVTIRGDLKAGGGTAPTAIIFSDEAGETGIGLNSQRTPIVAALTKLQNTWPADGGVLVLTIPRPLAGDHALALPAALLSDALIRDHLLAEKCAAIGTVAADGTLLAPDRLSRRLTALTSSGIETIILPEASLPDLQDMALEENLAPFFRFQILTAPTLEVAATLATSEPEEKLAKSLRDYKLVQDVARDSALAELTGFDVVKDTLGKILALNPQHASAKILIAHGSDKLPAHLTRLGSLAALYRSAGPIITTLKKDGTAQRDAVLSAYEGVNSLKATLDPATSELGDKISELLKTIGRFSTMEDQTSAPARKLKKEIFATWDTVRAEYTRLKG